MPLTPTSIDIICLLSQVIVPVYLHLVFNQVPLSYIPYCHEAKNRISKKMIASLSIIQK